MVSSKKAQIDKENIRFLNVVSQGVMAASTKILIDVMTQIKAFGPNFNTLIIINTSTTSAINVYLDGVKIGYCTANNGSFSFDWRDGINFNQLELENTDTVNAIAASTINITIGRTGELI